MRRTMEMIRYHTTIQEITRNHDRALINLESLRSGYNVRQRIYRDFQEPMLNVAHEQFGDNPLNTNSRSSSTANTSQAMNYEERKKSYPLLSQKKKGIVREQVVECKTTTEQYIHKSNKLCDRTWCFFVVREQNHEVSQFLNNPDLMRRTMEMIRYHTTIQEITRNHDRALINLESLRSGYNVRQRIYRDFQEPMLNVAHEQFGDNPLNTNSRSSSTANTSQTDELSDRRTFRPTNFQTDELSDRRTFRPTNFQTDELSDRL
ncbi:hypothetical protein GJ496_006787 [Pomphorhynchus laevis]|nr:hypothetical protein GJ496_006787 [Pomphorhynchus laevis]